MYLKIQALPWGLMAMGTNADAKVVRGYVTDREGKPVQGVKMVVMNEEQPGRRCFTSTDADGFFSVQVPDNMETYSFVRAIYTFTIGRSPGIY